MLLFPHRTHVQLCKRGRVHIFKYLEIEAIKLGHKVGITGAGTLGRKTRKSGGASTSPARHLTERLKQKRQNVDSGYSTASDSYDKRWSQDMGGTFPCNDQREHYDTDRRMILVDTEKHWSPPAVVSRTGEQNGYASNTSSSSTISPCPENVFDEDVKFVPVNGNAEKNDEIPSHK